MQDVLRDAARNFICPPALIPKAPILSNPEVRPPKPMEKGSELRISNSQVLHRDYVLSRQRDGKW